LGGEYGLDKALPTDVEGERLLNPSTFMTYMVGIILLGFSYVAFKLYINEASLWEIRAGWTLALLFFLRSIGDFNMLGLFKKVKNTEFSKYDTWVYVPLCFMISFLFIIELV
jgi:hypothetical protein